MYFSNVLSLSRVFSACAIKSGSPPCLYSLRFNKATVSLYSIKSFLIFLNVF